MTQNIRVTAALSLAATALLTTLWSLTQPEFSADPETWLATMADAQGRVQVSAMAFVLAQLPFAVGMLGLAAWLRPSRLATAGGVLALVGCFGHTVWGGVMLSQTVMATDEPNRRVYVGLLEDLEAAPVLIPFMALGLVGTVLGMLLLSVAWWRRHVEPRWVAPLLWAFLVVEFVGVNISDWAIYLSALLYPLALVTIAVRMGRGEPDASEQDLARPGPQATSRPEMTSTSSSRVGPSS